MSGLAYLLGVLVVAVGVALSIALHEIGHLLPAKRFGVKVTQYMVGFGPTIWSRRRGETEYGVKAIPLGGYIRMIGMFPPKPGQDPRFVRSSSTGRLALLADQARKQSMDEIQPGDEERVFYRLSVPKKLVVMLGGPTMNLLIAVVLLAIVVTGFGTAQFVPTLSSVSQCVLPVSAPDTASCQPSYPAAPAAAAGLRPGDVIVSVAGRQATSWDAVRSAIQVNGGERVPVVFDRAGHRQTVEVTPIVTDRPVVNADGTVVTGANGKPKIERVGFLGVSPTQALVPQPVTAVPSVVGNALGRTAGVFLTLPKKMVGIAQAAFGSGQRDPNGPVSVVGVGRFAGEIASAPGGSGAATGGIVYDLKARIADLLGIIASLNIALFVFNLIPLLPLDGGHVAGALWEGARRQFARLRRRPDPGPTDVARLLPIAYAMSTLLIVMSALLIYADIVRPIRLG